MIAHGSFPKAWNRSAGGDETVLVTCRRYIIHATHRVDRADERAKTR
jgi:hypothetical protein